jgi:hypothetical protein
MALMASESAVPAALLAQTRMSRDWLVFDGVNRRISS